MRACAAMTSASRRADARARSDDANASNVCAAPPPTVCAITIAAATICRAGDARPTRPFGERLGKRATVIGAGQHDLELASQRCVELVARFAQRNG